MCHCITNLGVWMCNLARKTCFKLQKFAVQNLGRRKLRRRVADNLQCWWRGSHCSSERFAQDSVSSVPIFSSHLAKCQDRLKEIRDSLRRGWSLLPRQLVFSFISGAWSALHSYFLIPSGVNQILFWHEAAVACLDRTVCWKFCPRQCIASFLWTRKASYMPCNMIIYSSILPSIQCFLRTVIVNAVLSGYYFRYFWEKGIEIFLFCLGAVMTLYKIFRRAGKVLCIVFTSVVSTAYWFWAVEHRRQAGL